MDKKPEDEIKKVEQLITQRPYHRPGTCSDFEKFTSKRKAWAIAHSLQTKLGYIIPAIENGNMTVEPHILGMMLRLMHRDLDDIKRLTTSEVE